MRLLSKPILGVPQKEYDSFYDKVTTGYWIHMIVEELND